MRIVMTADTVGGVWTYALELADALAERGVEVALVTMGAPLRPGQRSELRASRVRRAYAADYALEWADDPWRDVELAGQWLLEIADDFQPDIVHLNGYVHAALPWKVPTVVVGHSCVLSWHRAVRGTDAGPQWRIYANAVRRGLRSASLLVAPTHAMLDELVRLYDPSCPRLVIPNGRSTSVRALAKESFVLAAGRMWDEAKNLPALGRVASRLEWPVAIAGPGAPLGILSRAALDDLLARASVFAAPARYEPFGLTPLEAALAGCALVLGDIPSLREVWDDGAWFVSPDDDEALEHALAALLSDDGRRRKLAERARRRAARYTPARMADGYLAAYERVGAADPVEAA
jgi:glycogen(starch) synthase